MTSRRLLIQEGMVLVGVPVQRHRVVGAAPAPAQQTPPANRLFNKDARPSAVIE